MTDHSRSSVYVGGRWREVADSLPDISPLDGTVFAVAPDAGHREIELALASAREAFDHGHWASTTAEERADVLERFAAVIEKHEAELAELSILEWGQTNDEVAQISRAAPVLRAAAAAARDNVSASLSAPGLQGFTTWTPHGVVAAITPWNYPFHLSMVKVAYALAAGNTVILKPSPATPLAGLRIAEYAEEVDALPPGVLNVVTTSDAQQAARLTTDPRVDMVSFTGSTHVGKLIMHAAADTMKRTVLEMGGKSASLILPDADLEAAAAHAVYEGCTRHAGQVCSLYSRLLVHRSQHDEVVERVVSGVRSHQVGDRRTENVSMGPVISHDQQRRILEAVDVASEEGASVACGGRALDRRGYYVEPTVVTGVKPTMRIAHEEVFGPVLAVVAYDTVDEAVAIANGTIYGLAASVFGADSGSTLQVANRLRAGQTVVNGAAPLGPFGGHRQSGIGREHGLTGLRGYAEPMSVSAPTGGVW